MADPENGATLADSHHGASVCCSFAAESGMVNEMATFGSVIMKGKSRRFGPRLTVSLTEDDHEALTALADKDEVSISWVVRRAIEEYLRRRPTGVREGIRETMITSGN